MSEYTKDSNNIYFLNDKNIALSMDDTSVQTNALPSFDIVSAAYNEFTVFNTNVTTSVDNLCSEVSKLDNDLISVSSALSTQVDINRTNDKNELSNSLSTYTNELCASLSTSVATAGYPVAEKTEFNYDPVEQVITLKLKDVNNNELISLTIDAWEFVKNKIVEGVTIVTQENEPSLQFPAVIRIKWALSPGAGEITTDIPLNAITQIYNNGNGIKITLQESGHFVIEIDEAVVATQTDINNTNGRIDNLSNTVNDNLTSLTNRINTSDNNIDANTSSITTLNANISNLRDDVTTNTDDINDLEDNVASNTTSINTLINSVALINSDITAINSNITTNTVNINTISGNVTSNTTYINKISETLAPIEGGLSIDGNTVINGHISATAPVFIGWNKLQDPTTIGQVARTLSSFYDEHLELSGKVLTNIIDINTNTTNINKLENTFSVIRNSLTGIDTNSDLSDIIDAILDIRNALSDYF